MCTVVYIPVDDQVYFASLRDENPARLKAKPPSVQGVKANSFLAPADPLGGGTWAGISRYGNVVILLNGGFVNHVDTGSYSKSRGLIVTNLLQSVYPVVEWSMMELRGVAPFTLVVWCENNLFQLTWDGSEKHRLLLDHRQPAIWSSATLYTEAAKNKRKQLFDEWMYTQPLINHESVFTFFNTVNDSQNGFIMNRGPLLQTLSYSFITHQPDKGTFRYNDFSTTDAVTEEIQFDIYTPDLYPLFSTPGGSDHQNLYNAH